MPSSFLSSLIHAGRNPVGVGANYLPFPKVGEYANLGLAFTTPLGLMLPLCAFPHGNGPFIGGTTTKWLHSLAQGWRSLPWERSTFCLQPQRGCVLQPRVAEYG